MHLEQFNIQIRLTDTGEIISLELYFFLQDTDEERVRMTDKIRTKMESAAGNKPYTVISYVSHRKEL